MCNACVALRDKIEIQITNMTCDALVRSCRSSLDECPRCMAKSEASLNWQHANIKYPEHDSTFSVSYVPQFEQAPILAPSERRSRCHAQDAIPVD